MAIEADVSANSMPQQTGAPDTGRGDLPLAGLRILDLTHMLAGPYCTWLLGALGAQVIKVEPPGRGDATRVIGPFLDDASIYFMSVNRNKRSVTLNLKHPEGKQALLRLVQDSDVFIENNRPGVMSRLGLDYESLSKLNPRLVYASISGFGQTGPYSLQPSYDAVAQAMAGTMSITGEENGGPVRVGASIGDLSAGLFGAVGILSALQERNRTGKGTYVDVSMLDAQVALLENAFARFLNTGEVPRRVGSRHPLIVPFQAFPTRDEPIVVCADTEDQWQRLCEVLGRGDLIVNPLFADLNMRAANHPRLEPVLNEAFLTRGRHEWLDLLRAASVPAGPINSISDVAQDPQILARGMITKVGKGSFVAHPIRMESHADWPESPAPELGQHTDEVLAEIGYSPAQISRLRVDGTV